MTSPAIDNQPVMLFRDVTKVYPLPAGDVTALDGVSFTLRQGETLAVGAGEVHAVLIEPVGVLNTGGAGGPLTATYDDSLA